MRFKKIKLVSLFCFIALCFVFTGCATVSYSFIKPDDYTIKQQVKIELDSDEIEAHDADLQDMKTTIENYVATYNNNMQSLFTVNLLSLASSSVEEQILASFLRESVLTSYYWVGNTFYYDLVFSAIVDSRISYVPVENVYCYYYTGKFVLDNESDDDTVSELQDELFVQIYKETFTTSFDSTMCDTIEQTFLSKYGIYGFTLEDVAYVYKYGQQYSRLHSDADSIATDGDVYIHTWNLESKDEAITLFRTYAKPVAWYILAVVCGLVVIAVIIAIAKISSRKKSD